jgi:transposase
MRYELTDYEWAATRPMLPNKARGVRRGTIECPQRYLLLTAGEAHDNRVVLKLLSRLRSGSTPLADRAHDADWIRAFVTKKGAWANVPPRYNRREPICFRPHLFAPEI